MTAARGVVARNNVYRWAGQLLQELGVMAQARTQSIPAALRFEAVTASVA
jgi:hypothetical protein